MEKIGFGTGAPCGAAGLPPTSTGEEDGGKVQTLGHRAKTATFKLIDSSRR